jgi:hypothetical protein
MRLGVTGRRPATQTPSDQKVKIIAKAKTQKCNNEKVPGTQEAAQIKKPKMSSTHLHTTNTLQREKNAIMRQLREIIDVAQAQNPIFAVLIGSRPHTREPECPHVKQVKRMIIITSSKSQPSCVSVIFYDRTNNRPVTNVYFFSLVIATRINYSSVR